MSDRFPPTWGVAAAAVCLLSAMTVRAGTFEVILLPDTEDYAEFYPDVFIAQGEWIANQTTNENIVFVTHVGDAVHHPLARPVEWDTATDAMYQLDGLVPYSISPGNHDLEDPAGFVARFGPSHFASCQWYGGASSDNLNSYQVLSAGGYEFLHIALQKDPGTAARTWAREVIEANPGKPTIISTHDYLGLSGRTSAGNNIWNDLVKDHPQVFMVLNGHSRGVNRMISTNTSGKMVFEMLANYQDYTTTGGETDTGYLRKILFDPDNGKISVQTYSPTYTAQPWLTEDAHQFSLDVAFLPQVSGTRLSPIFVTDAATCRATGHAQGFEATPGPTGSSSPLGWTVWQIAGSAATFSAGNPLNPADIAAAGLANQTLLVVNEPPSGTWGDQIANASAVSGRALATNPGGNAAAVIQWKVTNGTGEPMSIVHLYYDLAKLWNSPEDDGSELPGYALFWSATGGSAAADWIKLGEDAVGSAKAWDINLPVALEPGADLYLRWADDNALSAGEAFAEDVWSLDNVRLVMTNVPDPSMRGDADVDGDVDAADYILLKRHIGMASDATWQQGDFDNDRDVDRDDFLILVNGFNGASGGAAAMTGAGFVPEPVTLSLLALGWLVFLRRRPR